MTAHQYITDASGKRTYVLVPIDEWEAMVRKEQRAKRKQEVLDGLEEAIEEVKEARKTGKKLPSLQDLLNEGLD